MLVNTKEKIENIIIVVASVTLIILVLVSALYYLAVINIQGAKGSSSVGYDACMEMFFDGDNWTLGYHNQTVWACSDSEVLIDPNG